MIPDPNYLDFGAKKMVEVLVEMDSVQAAPGAISDSIS